MKRRNTVRSNIYLLLKKYFQYFNQLAFGEYASRAFGFLTTMYLARTLGSENFGYYSFVTIFSQYFSNAANFGLDQYTISKLSVEKDSDNENLLREVVGSRFYLSILSACVFMVIGMFYAKDAIQRLFFAFQGLVIIGTSVSPQFYFIVKGKFKEWSFSTTGISLVVLTCVFFLIKQPWQYPYAALLTACIYFLSFSVAWKIVKPLKKQFFQISVRNTLLPLLKKSAPLFISSLMVQVYYSADIVFLGFMHPGIQLGYYTGAYKIILIIATIPPLVYAVFVRDIAKAKDDTFRNSSVRLYITILLVLGIFFSLLLYGADEFIITVVLGKAFLDAKFVLHLLTINLFFIFVNVALANLLIAWDEHKRYMFIVMCGAAVNIGCNIFLIPLYGIYGAAISTILSEVAVFVASLYFHIRFFGLFRRKV